jgi:hypothetical protein
VFYENVDPVIVQLFLDYIKECREAGIRLILVYPPEYFEGQDFVGNRKEIVSLIKDIADRNGLPYLDYSDHPLTSKKEYFYNSQHLNMTGANIFTAVFCDDLKSITLASGKE